MPSAARDDPAGQDRAADPAAAKQRFQLAALARARDRLPAHECQLVGGRGAAGARRRHEDVDISEAVPEGVLQRLLAKIIPQGLPQLVGDRRPLRHQAIKQRRRRHIRPAPLHGPNSDVPGCLSGRA